MNSKNEQKPSLILMLAPVAIILLGYYYFFFMELQSNLTTRRDQAEAIVKKQSERDANTPSESAVVVKKIRDVNRKIATGKSLLAKSKLELTQLEAQRRRLWELALGRASALDQQANPLAGKEKSNGQVSGQVPADANSTVSILKSIVALVSQDSLPLTGPLKNQGGTMTSGPIASSTPIIVGDSVGTMMWICKICDRKNLRRISNRVASSSESFDESDRNELGKLLGKPLPAPAFFELRLEGSFLNLIAALHEVTERLPMVTIESLSMDLAQPEDQSRRWLLTLGISGP